MGLKIDVVAEHIYEGADNGVLELFAKVNAGALRSLTVSDMVNKVAGRAGAQKIELLRLFGHGNEGLQTLGGGYVGTQPDFTKLNAQAIFLNGAVLSHQASLGKLQGKFDTKAVVELHGCLVGRGAKGQALCTALARFWNVIVRAGIDDQRADAGNVFESGHIQVYPSGRVIQFAQGSSSFVVVTAAPPPAPTPPVVANNDFEPDYPVTKTGLMLSNVSKERYGTFELWPLIYDDNRALMANGPNKVPVGKTLKIRKKEKYTPAEFTHAKKNWQNWQTYR